MSFLVKSTNGLLGSRNAAIAIPAAIVGLGLAGMAGRSLIKPLMVRRAKSFWINMLGDANITVGKDIIVSNDEVFLDWMNRGMLAIGETYMAEQWTVADDLTLDEILTRLMKLPSDKKRKAFKSWDSKLFAMAARVFNYQSPARAGIVGAHHYDLGNDFFKLWLDPYMQYSCAYWKDVDNLDAAQEQKLHLIAKKLKMEPGMTVLEIGCGWGGLACFFAKHYGVKVTGITISNEQLNGAREWAKREGVSHLTEFKYQDYREMEGEFDRVVSIAMLEAVGYKNMDHYYNVIKRNLKNGGLALVHSITANRSTKTAHQRWILKYIFPNGFLPSVTQMCEFAEKKMIVEDVHNLGPDYNKTCMAWDERFWEHVNNGTIVKSEVFKRMWHYYLCYCASGFRARTLQLHQVVYSKHRADRYDAVR